MQTTIEFENELVKRYPADNQSTTKEQESKSQVEFKDGKVHVEASGSSAAEIRQKYQ